MALRAGSYPPASPSPYDGQRMTEEEFLALDHVKPRLEYIDGRAVQKPATKRKHVRIARVMTVALDAQIQRHGGDGGPEPHIWFESEHQYRLPDVVYWAPGKPQGDDNRMLPPTLAVEVRSPDETMDGQRAKCRFYRAHGVDVAWLIDPESRTVEVFEGDRDGHALPPGSSLESPMLPGFSLPLAELFGVLDR